MTRLSKTWVGVRVRVGVGVRVRVRVRAGARARVRVRVTVGVGVRIRVRVRVGVGVRVRVRVGVGVRINEDLLVQRRHGGPQRFHEAELGVGVHPVGQQSDHVLDLVEGETKVEELRRGG